MNIGNHEMNLPWEIDPSEPGRIIDCKGVPVAFGSSTTSLLSESDGERTYRTTDTVSGVRARIIVDAVNQLHGDRQCLT